MDRRKSIKSLVAVSVSSGLLLHGCNVGSKKNPVEIDNGLINETDRMEEEKASNKKLKEEKFFTLDELATIKILADIIIPRDEVSGNASDAKVPEFIEFIVKDKPEQQTPIRGGIRWLDMQCLKKYSKSFKDLDDLQQLEMVDQIAYPDKAKKEFKQGVSFFNLMRNLTISGFYTSEIGFKDIGYMGNRPNQWEGVPDEVLKQYNISYTEKEIKECVNYKL